MATESEALAGSAPAHEYVLPVEGFKGTPDEIERQWYERCYKGRGDSMLQLTWRAVIMGSLLGGILSLTNLYIGLKSGWGFGVAITACILSYAIWTALRAVTGGWLTPMTILENNCMQSCASSAGYSTGGTLVSAIAAYIVINGHSIPTLPLMAWVFFLAVLGVTMAIPMKRQMINIEQLRFPSGIAAAGTLRALHTGGKEGLQSATALGIAWGLAAVNKFWTDGLTLISSKLEWLQLGTWVEKFNVAFFVRSWAHHGMDFTWEPMFIAAGAITGLRACMSMFVGAVLCWMVFMPIGLDRGAITLSVTEPLPVVPAGVELRATPRLKQSLTYEARQGELRWEGVMLPADRDALLAQSDDPEFRTAVERLFVRSQFRASEPLPTLSAGANAEASKHGLKYDAEHHRLQMPEIISMADWEAARTASTTPEYQAAAEALYARSRLPSYEPLWSGVGLAALPKDAAITDAVALRLKYDSDKRTLLWRGPMSAADRDQLDQLSKDPAYRTAIAALAVAATQREMTTLPPAEPNDVIRYDTEQHVLIADGPVSAREAKRWRAAAESNVAGSTAVEAVIEASHAKRAAENFRDLVSWSLWAGAACMVTSGLFSFALQWKSAVRAFADLGKMFLRRHHDPHDPLQAIETPTSWFIGGQIVGTVGLAWLARAYFDMPVWLTVVAVLMSFGLALVACRVCGETDQTPVGAMGKITQLAFGAIRPGAMNINLMSACVTAGAADSSSDLLTDLKSGYLLGAHPRRQFIAQFSGIFVGTLVSVWSFNLLASPKILGSKAFPAPAALTWSAVARALGEGLEHLPPLKIWLIVVGAAVGIVLPLLAAILPAKAAKWVPSAAALGLSWTFNFHYSLFFLVGAIIGYFWEKGAPKNAEQYLLPVVAGLTAGESLTGVGIEFARYAAG